MNAAGRKAALNVWNADGHIILLKFTHASITTQRLALHMTDVVSTVDGGSATYTAFPFEIELPTDDKGAARGTLRISNVTKIIWDLIGSVRTFTPPQLAIYRVLESDVNTAQDSFLLLDVQRIAANILSVEANFSQENYASEPYPAARVIGKYCPWMLYVG
jgi:hypothetical protein